jgi:hypothetical protein
MRPSRLFRSAIVLKPSTLLHLRLILTQRRYRLRFSSKGRLKPGPKGPSKELMDAIVATFAAWLAPRSNDRDAEAQNATREGSPGDG